MLLEKIYSYNPAIQSALLALKEGLTRHQLMDTYVEHVTMVVMEKVIQEQPEVWKKGLRPLIAAVMAQLNAQAKLIQGLANIMQYQQSNLKEDGSLLFDYTTILLPMDAILLYVLEYLNFTVSMGKTPADWAGVGEGLFFALYFDTSCRCGFHVGAKGERRPLWSDGFIKDSSWYAVVDAKLVERRKEREVRWHEMYPALSKDRIDAEAEIAAFLSAVQIVANKDANYKGACQEGWTSIAATLKDAFPDIVDVDAVPILDLMSFFEQHEELDGRLFVLDEFFALQFAFAQTCTALRLDLLSDKRLPSIARVLAIAAVADWRSGKVPTVQASEWWFALAYGSPAAHASPCLQQLQRLWDSTTPLTISRKTINIL
jgi:hypothetical protein